MSAGFFHDDFFGGRSTGAIRWIPVQLSWFGALQDANNLISTDFADSGGGVITVTTKLDAIRDGYQEACLRRAPMATVAAALGVLEADIAAGKIELHVRIAAQSLPDNEALFGVGVLDDAAQATASGTVMGYRSISGIKNASFSATADVSQGPANVVGAHYQLAQFQIAESGTAYVDSEVLMISAGVTEDVRALKGATMGGSPALELCLFAGSNTAGGTTGAHSVLLEIGARNRPGWSP